MATSIVSPQVVKPKSLNCPGCGAPVELRGFAHTLTVVCPNCLSVLDATTPEFQILQTFQGKQRVQPKIPLGSRGKIAGTLYEVIGFQQREVQTGDDVFCWDEYLLFNPYQGFRYLTEYQGHWNFVRVMSALPAETKSTSKRAVYVQGRTYNQFDTLTAQTAFVLGEFPWRVHVGDAVQVQDFIAPPYMLSSESTDAEVAWSLGEYTPGAQLWQAFGIPGAAPRAEGIFANQPSPYQAKVRSSWRTWLWLNVALAALAFLFTMLSANRTVFDNRYSFAPWMKNEASFVTPPFEIPGHTSNVELSVHTDLDNNWAYFNFALINEDTGQAFDFGREVSYYRDSDGSEGKPSDSVIIPRVPSGRYYLRVEPEMDSKSSRSVSYQLTLRRDVPNHIFFWLAAVLLLIPPIVTTVRSATFEGARWRESDFGSMGFAGGGGDD